MAVYTPVEGAALSDWLAHFDVGQLTSFEGIAGGIENSNFFVSTSRGEYVLTLFERLAAADLPFYLELMRHLSARGIACPAPQVSRDHQLFLPLNGKPAALVTRLPGHWLATPTPAALRCTARALASMHLAGTDFALHQPNPRGPQWWRETLPLVAPHLDAALEAVLRSEIDEVSAALAATPALPTGPIHADLFRDNVLFDQHGGCGFIDFYFAGCDAWLFDVAVCVNDWCIDSGSGSLHIEKARHFLDAYASVRAFVEAEVAIWPIMLRAAALRFWLSRLADIVAPRTATLLTPHDPRHFERIVLRRRGETAAPPVPLPR